jgi:uncharacterized protein YndB with AHSA1/START domain
MTPTTSVTVTRTIPASVADVYDVWMDPTNPGSPRSDRRR